MRIVPPEVWTHWPLPNYDNPEQNTTADVAVQVVLLAITFPIVAFRLYARSKSRRRLGIDDLFCALGLIMAIGFTAVCLISALEYNSTAHLWDIRVEYWTPSLKLGLAGKILFVTAGACVRQSLLSFYRRIVDPADIRKFTYAIWALMIANWTSCIVFNALDIFTCSPIWLYWTYETDATGTCLNEGVAVMACGAIIALIDTMILLLPMLLIARLQMPLRRKIEVCILLSMGLIATVAAVLRIWFTWKAMVTTYDLSWWVTPLWISAAVEIYIALLCSCAPAIQIYLQSHKKRLRIFERILPSKPSNYSTDETLNDDVGTQLEGQFMGGDKPSYCSHLEKGIMYDSTTYKGSYAGPNDLYSVSDCPRSQISAPSLVEKSHVRYTPEQTSSTEPSIDMNIMTEHTIGPVPGPDFSFKPDSNDTVVEERPFQKRSMTSSWAARQEANMLAARQARDTSSEMPSSVSVCSRFSEEEDDDNDERDDTHTDDGDSMHAAETAVEMRLSPVPSFSWRKRLTTEEIVSAAERTGSSTSNASDEGDAAFLDDDSGEDEGQVAVLSRIESAKRYRIARQKLSSLRSAG